MEHGLANYREATDEPMNAYMLEHLDTLAASRHPLQAPAWSLRSEPVSQHEQDRNFITMAHRNENRDFLTRLDFAQLMPLVF